MCRFAAILAGRMQSLRGLRFLFVTGKGGVGKSTVAALLAARLASEGRRVLLAFPSESLGQARLLGKDVGTTPVKVGSFSAVAIDSDESMKQYAQTVLRSQALTALLFHGKMARGFLRGIPGLAAWALLGKTWSYVAPEAGGPRDTAEQFDTVIFDAPATGDGTDILRVPQVILELAPIGSLRKDAQACLTLLRDPALFRVLPVTLLEDLPVTETEELIEAVRHDLAMPIGPLIVNQARPELFATGDRTILSAKSPVDGSIFSAAEQGTKSDAVHTLDLASQRAREEALAKSLRERVFRHGLPVIEAPFFSPEPTGELRLAALCASLAETLPDSYRQATS